MQYTVSVAESEVIYGELDLEWMFLFSLFN